MARTHYGLPEAAALLGKSERQVRYLIQNGKLAGEKVEGRWRISADALRAHPERQVQTAEKREAIREAVERALPEGGDVTPWSVRSMRAVKHALQLHRSVTEAFSATAPEAEAVAQALRYLVRGGHAFERAEKRRFYQEARLASCDALSALLLRGTREALAFVEVAESGLMPALAGLLRRSESPRGSR